MIEITIAIPTRNAENTLPRVLDRVTQQSTRYSFEILAVDWGSRDNTLSILQTYHIRTISYPDKEFNWGSLREVVFLEARGNIVVNLSQDAIPAHPRWLDALVAPLQKPQIGAACGVSIPDPSASKPQFTWEKNGYFYFTREMQRFRKQFGKGLSFANAAVPKTIWQQFHFEPIPLGEDFQLQKKLISAGYHIAFPSEAVVFHHHSYTLKQVTYRAINEGLALRQLGFPYSFRDALADFLCSCPHRQWVRECLRGNLRNPAEFFYPYLRPWAVYWGSTYAKQPRWY